MVKSLKIGISGSQGVEKTETLEKIIDMLDDEGITVGGMVSDPIMENNRRVGYQVMNWQNKEKAVFAHLNLDTMLEIEGYGVNLDSLEEVGVKAIQDAAETRDVILVDEIGKMQVESEAFNQTVKRAMELNKPMILTFQKKSRNTLLQDIRRRDDVRMLELTDVNKDLLPYKIVDLITEEM